jgi:hypothetical protein
MGNFRDKKDPNRLFSHRFESCYLPTICLRTPCELEAYPRLTIADLNNAYSLFQPSPRCSRQQEPTCQSSLGQMASRLDDGLGAGPQAEGQAELSPGESILQRLG